MKFNFTAFNKKIKQWDICCNFSIIEEDARKSMEEVNLAQQIMFACLELYLNDHYLLSGAQ